MKKASIKRLSILGLVLMAASAVTASILPNKSGYKGIAGTKRMEDTNDGLTCIPIFVGIGSCTFTLGTTTTNFQGDSYTGVLNNEQTRNNTSIIEIIDFEPTSIVEQH